MNAVAAHHQATVPPSRAEIASWAAFDFANSSFTTIMVTVLFPVYFTETLCGGDSHAARWWGWAISGSNLLVVIASPFVGAHADRLGCKKAWLVLTTLLCVCCTATLTWMPSGWIAPALLLFGTANAAFLLGENLIAGFLPELSTSENAGRISSWGWSIGYFGGLLSLIAAKMTPSPWWILVTALFFAVASLPTFLFLRERKQPEPLEPGENWIKTSLTPVITTVRHVGHHMSLVRVLGSYFFSMCGLVVVIAFAGIFASQQLGMNQGQLTTLFLVLQFSAAGGAWGFGWLQDRYSSRAALSLSLALWTLVALACALVQNIPQFYAVALMAGIGVGSFQSCARATVSLYTPENKSGEFFGFWGLSGKLAGVVGPLIFAELTSLTGMRTAIGSMSLFFLAGWWILTSTRTDRE